MLTIFYYSTPPNIFYHLTFPLPIGGMPSEMMTWKQSRDPRPPVLIRVRSSDWFIGITVFVAAFNVCTMPVKAAPILLPPTSAVPRLADGPPVRMALAMVLSVAVQHLNKPKRLTDPRWSPSFPSHWSKGREKVKKTVCSDCSNSIKDHDSHRMIVQFWLSSLLVAFGLALTISARELR